MLRDLVDRWLEGFCASRRVPLRRLGEVVEVEVAGESRRLELVLVEPSDELLLSTASRLIGTDDVWLTAFGAPTDEPRRRPVPDGVRVQLEGEVLMTVALRRPDRSAARVAVRADGDRAFASVSLGGAVVSRGQVAVVGETATFDRVSTDEAHQRQGLGGAVMGALATWALDAGAVEGVLAASVQGQALYRTLGWAPAASMVTLSAVGTVGECPD